MTEHSEQITTYLNLFPEVTWDRYVEYDDTFSVFGWIARDDGRSDFYTMDFKKGLFNSSKCSSARYSKEFWSRICAVHPELPLDAHIDCRRVEDLGWPVKCVYLKEDDEAA